MLQVYESNDLARAVVHVLRADTSDALTAFVRSVVSREVAATKQNSTLFRTDSTATRTMIQYLKIVDQQEGYLRRALLPPILTVMSRTPSDPGFEVDPDKMLAGEDLSKNARNLQESVERFLHSILQAEVPAEIRFVLSVVRDTVSRTFPASALTAVGGIFFLRFLGPAIFAPEGFGLVKAAPPGEARRGLTLIAKTIQNAANGVVFGLKEQFMVPFNEVIEKNTPRIFAFLDEISRPVQISIPSISGYTSDQKTKNLAIVINSLRSNLPKIEQRLQEDLELRARSIRLINPIQQLQEVDRLLTAAAARHIQG